MQIFFEVLDRSRKFHAAMNQVLNGIESGSIRPSRKITPDEMRSRFYKVHRYLREKDSTNRMDAGLEGI